MYLGTDPANPNLHVYMTRNGERIKSALPPTEFRDHRRGAPGVVDEQMERQMDVNTALPASDLPSVPGSVGGAPQWIQRGVEDPQAAGATPQVQQLGPVEDTTPAFSHEGMQADMAADIARLRAE